MIRSLASDQLAGLVHGTVVGTGPSVTVSHLALDSRRLTSPEDSLFIAIRGEHHDGHDYLQAAWERGVRCFLIDSDSDVAQLTGSTVVRVPDSKRALQQLAGWRRSLFQGPVIGITGSNGKTTVKEWLNVLLADDHVICRSPRSFNSQVGVPLSVWTLEEEHSLAIFEAGISQPHEMEALEKVIRPDIGILTTIGEAHLEYLGTKRAIAEEKCILFRGCKHIVFPADNAEALQVLSAPPYASIPRTSWSVYQETDLSIRAVHSVGAHAEVTFTWKDNEHFIHFPFSDPASLENGYTCLATMLYLGYSVQVIQERVERLTPLEMRLQQLQGGYDAVLINDAYSNDVASLEIAIDHARTQSAGLPLTVILSDIPQSGMQPRELYERVNTLLVRKRVNRLIGIGPNIHSARELFRLPTQTHVSVEEFLRSIRPEHYARECVLIKGAREFRFERIVAALQEQSHETVLEIDLDAMTHNLHYFRSKLSPGTQTMAMVKAFGYGSGAKEVASLLEFNQVDRLAVAYADEGAELRKAGISLPIMVMNPEAGSFPTIVHYHLEPEIYSFRILESFCAALQHLGAKDPFPVHIKLDTGMHRLGFEGPNIAELGERLKTLPVRVVSVFTHLAATDDPEHDAFTVEQLARFDGWSDTLSSALGYPVLRHALNTGGIQRFPGAQYDMVRLGVGLYGIAAHAAEQEQLRTVSTLRTVISQIRTVRAGESVGYGRSFIARSDVRIATIPLGYADGLRRSLSNGVGVVMIGGHRCPIVGKVCMDMTMVDVSGIACSEGDPVEVFGRHLSLSEFAERSGTIAYEILTSISQRVRRVYLRE